MLTKYVAKDGVERLYDVRGGGKGFVAIRIEGRTIAVCEVLLILRGRRIDQRRTDGFRECTSSVLSRSCA